MGGLTREESGELIVIQGTGDVPSVSDRIPAISKGPSVIGKTILPEGVRGSQDLMGLVRNEIWDILSEKKPALLATEGEISDVEFTETPNEIPKIGN